MAKADGCFKSLGFESLGSFCLRFGDMTWKTSESIPIFDIPSSLFAQQKKPCIFQTSSLIMFNKLQVLAWCPRYRPTAFFVSHLQLLSHMLGGSRRIPQILQHASSKRPERRIPAIKPSQKRVASDAIVGINFKMGWDSTNIPSVTSQHAKADSATPFVACPQTGPQKLIHRMEHARNVALLS